MNPVIAAAAVKAGNEARKSLDVYVSNVGKAVLSSQESQEDVEKKLHLPKGSINKMAEGRDDPKLSTVIGIASILGVSLDKGTGYVAEKREEKAMKKEASLAMSEEAIKLQKQTERIEALKQNLAAISSVNKDEKTANVLGYVDTYLDAVLEESKVEEKKTDKKASKKMEKEASEDKKQMAANQMDKYQFDSMFKNLEGLAEEKGLITEEGKSGGYYTDPMNGRG